MLNVENFVTILQQYSNIAFIISIFTSIVIALLGVIPSIFVTGANIIFFGSVKGVIISLLGEVIGGVISFWLYRKGFKKRVEDINSKNKYLNQLLKSKGRDSVYLVFLTRLLPFVPSGFVTLAASISDINIIGFTLATFFGKIPSILLEGIVSYNFINNQEMWIKLIITIFSIALIWKTIKKSSKNKDINSN